MTTDGAGLTDEVIPELNPPPAEVTDAEPGLHRPADSASKADWVEYVVALGADRAAVAGESEHWDPTAVASGGTGGDYVRAPELTKAELVELADRLNG